MTIAETTSAKVERVKAKAEQLRDRIADVLARARGPTDAKEVWERIKRPSIALMDVRFQLDRMTEEGRTVKEGGGYVLAEG